jgi:hypothetical protein
MLEMRSVLNTFIAKSWNSSILCCTRWILNLTVEASLSNCTVSSFAHPAGGAANFSKMLLLNVTSLLESLGKGNASAEEENARTAETVLRRYIAATVTNLVGRWKRTKYSKELGWEDKKFKIEGQNISIYPSPSPRDRHSSNSVPHLRHFIPWP